MVCHAVANSDENKWSQWCRYAFYWALFTFVHL